MGDAATIRQMLAEGQIDPNIQNEKGVTALMLAPRFKRSLETIQALLVDPRTDPNIQDDNGRTALMKMAQYSSPNRLLGVQALLADPRTNPDIQDKAGWTALMVAARNSTDISSLKTLRALMQGDADLTLKNKRGETASDLCVLTKCREEFKKQERRRQERRQRTEKRLKIQHLLARQFGRRSPLPADVWMLILRRRLQQELCADLSRDIGSLKALAKSLGLPVTRGGPRRTMRELCQEISDVLAFGGIYSSSACAYLQNRSKEAQALVGQLISEAQGAGIDIETTSPQLSPADIVEQLARTGQCKRTSRSTKK